MKASVWKRAQKTLSEFELASLISFSELITFVLLPHDIIYSWINSHIQNAEIFLCFLPQHIVHMRENAMDNSSEKFMYIRMWNSYCEKRQSHPSFFFFFFPSLTYNLLIHKTDICFFFSLFLKCLDMACHGGQRSPNLFFLQMITDLH